MEKAFALQVIRRGNTAIALVDEVGFQPRLEFERYIKRLILSPVKPKNPMCGNGDLYRFIPFLRFSFFFFIFRLAISRLDGDFSFSCPPANELRPLNVSFNLRRIIEREKLFL